MPIVQAKFADGKAHPGIQPVVIAQHSEILVITPVLEDSMLLYLFSSRMLALGLADCMHVGGLSS